LDFDQTFTSAAIDNGASEVGDFMIKEHHRVVLKKDVPDHGLKLEMSAPLSMCTKRE
jgi:hypothetical protein